MELGNILTIKIEYENTLTLHSFKESLDGWYREYNKHLININNQEPNETLLIKVIKKDSIIIDLISSVMPLLSEFNNIYTFYSSVRSIVTWLHTKKGSKPKYDIDDLVNIKKIFSPVVHDDNRITFSIKGDNNTINVIDKVIVNKLNENADIEITKLSQNNKPEPLEDSSIRKNIILKFIQIEGTENSINKNTKGIISDIDKKPRPVMFEEGIKHQIIREEPFPFNRNYLADVKVHTLNNKINVYTVLAIKDSYEDENEDQSYNSLFTEDN
jgi:hypothetical protein